MSNWSTGANAEKKYIEMLVAKGFKPEWIRRFPKTKFYSQDFFGVDIVALNCGRMICIQVKSCKDRFPSLDKKTRRQLTRLFYQLPLSGEVYWAGYNRKLKRWREIKIE